MSERQLQTELSKIRTDHVARYDLAAKTVSGNVIDAACGCGYGSYIIAKNCANLNYVAGFDIDSEAVAFANKHWKHEKNIFAVQDLTKLEVNGKFDYVVSFETIEHIIDPIPFLTAVSKITNKLLCSVPNQDVIPFEKKRFPYHHRHYTPDQIKMLLATCGFKVTKIQYQNNAFSKDFTVRPGRTIIIEANTEV